MTSLCVTVSKASQAQPRLQRCHRDEGKVIALFPTTLCKQPTRWAFSPLSSLFFFSFLFFLFACGCSSCHLGVCRVIIDGPLCWSADRTLRRKRECSLVCAARRLFHCQHVFLLISPPLSLSCSFCHLEKFIVRRPVLVHSSDDDFFCYLLLFFVLFLLGRERKQSPALLILLLFPTCTVTLWFCGHRQRWSGG